MESLRGRRLCQGGGNGFIRCSYVWYVCIIRVTAALRFSYGTNSPILGQP